MKNKKNALVILKGITDLSKGNTHRMRKEGIDSLLYNTVNTTSKEIRETVNSSTNPFVLLIGDWSELVYLVGYIYFSRKAMIVGTKTAFNMPNKAGGIDCIDCRGVPIEEIRDITFPSICQYDSIFLKNFHLVNGDINVIAREIEHIKLESDESKNGTLIIHVDNRDRLDDDFIEMFEVIDLSESLKPKTLNKEDKLEPISEPLSPKTEDYLFRYKGGHWEIIFDKRTIYPTNSIGLKYISFVLSNHNKELYNYAIYQMTEGVEKSTTTKDQSDDSGLQLDRTTKINTTKAEKRNAYKEHEKLLHELDKKNKELELEKFELEKDGLETSELEEINKQLNDNHETLKMIVKGFRPDGKFGGDKERITKNVYTAIYRNLKLIEKEHPPLRQHLKAFFTNGKEYTSYRPDKNYPWQTDYS